MSKVLYLPFVGSPTGGGPHIFCYKFASAIQKMGHKVIYDKPGRAHVALGIIESGKLLRKVDRNKTKVCVRIDNAYFKGYWDGSPGREWRSDMSSLHNAIRRDFDENSGVDHVIFQSEFSRRMICDVDKIAERKDNYSIIHNGTDTNTFSKKNIDKKLRDFILGQKLPILGAQLNSKIKLIFHAKMRNGYIMESLLGVVDELKTRGHDVVLLFAGSMDAECSSVYKNYNNQGNVFYLGSYPNNHIPTYLSLGDIYINPRMGSSSDNTIVEALSMSLPVVIPSFGGNSELITDGQEGVIVPSGHWDYGPDHIHRLACGVEQIIPDLDNYKLRARKHAESNLNINNMVNKYLKVMGL